MSVKIGVLGTGDVAKALSAGFAARQHEVRVAARTRDRASAVAAELAAGSPPAVVGSGTFEEVAAWAELAVLAVKGSAAEAALRLAGPMNLAGKVLIDVNNPIADTPPVNGVLSFFTGPNESLLERLQSVAPQARCVKAWSCVGSPFMVEPQFAGGPPTMFICGDDGEARLMVQRWLVNFGWDVEDCGAKEAARAIEPLCRLWCIPGLRENRWRHAFKLLRA